MGSDRKIFRSDFFIYSRNPIFVKNPMGVRMNDTEKDFVHRINVKEEAAFHDLFTRFRNYLVLFAMRRIEQLDVAEDIVQETFITIWENERMFNSYQGLKAYLYELVQNKCTNYLKHRQVEDKYASYVKTTREETEGDYNLMQEEIYRELYMAIRELPEKCQRVFELHLEGKKNAEIAEILGISVLTVKSHKQNAIHVLKEKMGNLFLLYVYIYET